MAKTIKVADALKDAVYVSDDISMKTAIQQGKLVVISTDNNLYVKLLDKFPKEKLTKKVSKTGKVMTVAGVFITVASGGLLSSIGIPLAGIGIAGSVAGDALDNYENYSIRMDYDNKQVQFIKTKGNPHVKL